MDEQIYMESYVACNGSNFMVYQILRQAHLKEVGLRGTSHWRLMAHDLDLKYLMGGKGQDFASH